MKSCVKTPVNDLYGKYAVRTNPATSEDNTASDSPTEPTSHIIGIRIGYLSHASQARYICVTPFYGLHIN
jgi:hypothetical protein